MKLILKIFKWICIIIVAIILLFILSGIGYRLFSSEPVPTGKLVDVDGTKLHIIEEGEKNDLPTLILESGAGGTTDVYHWLAKDLSKKMRVIRYDREGKGFSESSEDVVTSDFYAKQLYKLLEKNGEKPPYILVGHSMGGPYNRIFRDVYPNDVEAMVFIDSSHPEQWKRLAQKSLFDESLIGSMKTFSILADMGIVGFLNVISGSESINDGLPEDCHTRSQNLTAHSGKVYRRYIKENEINDDVLLRASKTKSLDSLPVLVFTAKEQYREPQKEKYRRQGIDPEKQLELWYEMQKELKDLSTNSKQFLIDANHGSIITKKENAEKISKEILSLAESISRKK